MGKYHPNHEPENELGENGRILVCKSGTENLIRVMVKGKNQKQIEKIANEIIAKMNLK